MKKHNCINCGAEITTEICPYCSAQTGLKENLDVQDLPKIQCKDAELFYWTFSFPLIMGIIFTAVPTFLFLVEDQPDPNAEKILPLFLIVGTLIIISALIQLGKNLLVNIFGKKITGTVCSYVTNNSLTYNGFATKLVKIKIEKDNKEEYIYYNIRDMKEPYRINSKIQLKRFNNLFLIIKEEVEYF